MVLIHRHISNLRLDLSICRLYSALVSTKVLYAAAPANWVSADTLHVPLEPSRGWPETFLQRKPIQSVLPLFLLQRQSSSGSSIWQQHLTRIQKTQVRIQAGSQCLFSPSNNSANITSFFAICLRLVSSCSSKCTFTGSLTTAFQSFPMDSKSLHFLCLSLLELHCQLLWLLPE